MEQPKPSRSSWSIFTTSMRENRKGVFRMWLFMSAIYMISLLLGGIRIWMIVFGLFFASRRVFIYWKPARLWMAKAFDLKFPEQTTNSTSIIYKVFVGIFHFGIALLYIGIGFYICWLGISGLLDQGFLKQNLIYMIFLK